MALPEDSHNVEKDTNVLSSINPALAANSPTSRTVDQPSETEESRRPYSPHT